jgi:CAAX prenyl protease-like protein
MTDPLLPDPHLDSPAPLSSQSEEVSDSTTDSSKSPSSVAAVLDEPAMPYVVPMFVFLLLSSIEPDAATSAGTSREFLFPLAYTAKVLIVGALTAVALFRYGLWRDLVPRPNLIAAITAILAGLLVFGLWIGLDGLYPPLPFLGTRSAFDPNSLRPFNRSLFIGVRLLGLVVLVPIFEELFWRSFLMRWLVEPEFQKRPVGTVTLMSAIVTSVLFALVHPEWLPALLTGLIWAGLLRGTRSLSACVLSHAVANLALGIYVLSTQQWKFW